MDEDVSFEMLQKAALSRFGNLEPVSDPTFDHQLYNYFGRLKQSLFENPLLAAMYSVCGNENGYDILHSSDLNITSSVACGHLFGAGDGIYRCLDCGYDGTCVLCSKCFKASDHEGHDTTYSFSAGSGGCCDCGDVEAWKVKGTCEIHDLKKEMFDQTLHSLPLELEVSLRRTIATALDFIIGVLVNMPDLRISPSAAHPTTDLNEYYIILWNDEFHSFDQVINQLGLVGIDEESARDIANSVDDTGRSPLSFEYHQLSYEAVSIIESIGLCVSVRKIIDYQAEETAAQLMEFIKDLPESVAGYSCDADENMIDVENQVRTVICEELAKQSLLVDSTILTPAIASSAKCVSRIDYLLLSYHKLWKYSRVVLKQLLITTLVVQPDYKKMLASRFATHYISLAKQHLLELDMNSHSILSLSVQLFTVPSIARFLIDETSVFDDIILVIKTESMRRLNHTFDQTLPFSLVPCKTYPVYEWQGNHEKLFHYFNDLQYLALYSRFSAPLLDLLTFYQGMHAMTRAVLAHVEYEDDWSGPFRITLYLLKIARLASTHLTNIDLLYSISQVMDRFYERETGQLEDLDVVCGVRVKGRQSSVSIHCPLHWYLASLLVEGLKEYPNATSLFQSQLDLFFKPRVEDKMEDIDMNIFQSVIISMSLVAQVEAGFWVRNGFKVRYQIEVYMVCEGYDKDLFLVQVALSKNVKVLACLMNHFGITEYFDHVERGVTNEPRVGARLNDGVTVSLVRDFYHLLISLLSERSMLTSLPLESKIKIILIHLLAASSAGLSHSEITSKLSSMIKLNYESDDEFTFEETLRQVATFKYPEGLVDVGLYTLKDEYYTGVNAWHWSYSRNQRESLEEILKKRNLNNLQPVLMELPEMLKGLDLVVKSVIFSDMLLMGLWVAVKPLLSKTGPILDEGLLSELIHLIILAITISDDDSFYHNISHTTLNNGGVNIIKLVLALLDRSEVDEVKSRLSELEFIADKIGLYDPYVQDWKDGKNKPFYALKAVKLESEDEKNLKRKQLAKERQALIKSEFLEKQKKFMMNHLMDEEDFEGFDEGVQEESHQEYPTGTCLVCQEDCSSAPYGILCMKQESSIKRQTDIFHPSKSLYSTTLDQEEPPEEEGENHFDAEFNRILSQKVVLTTSCLHLMHVACFERYMESIVAKHRMYPHQNHPEQTGQFLCPFCKSLGNCLLPIIWKSKKEVVHQKVLVDQDELHAYVYGLKFEVAKEDVDVSESKRRAVMAPLTNNWVEDRITRQKWDYVIGLMSGDKAAQLCSLLLNQIVSVEIMTRGVKGKSYIGILDGTTNQSLSLLRVLSESCLAALFSYSSANEIRLKAFSINSKTIRPLRDCMDNEEIMFKDGFELLVEYAMNVLPDQDEATLEHMYHWIKIFGLFEYIRSIISIFEGVIQRGDTWLTYYSTDEKMTETESLNLARMIKVIDTQLCVNQSSNLILSNLEGIHAICAANQLLYARKCVLLLYARFGVVPPQEGKSSTVVKGSELFRLKVYLDIPADYSELIATFVNLVYLWCDQLFSNSYWSSLADNHYTIQRHLLDTPMILKLVRLPTKLESLFDDIVDRECIRCDECIHDCLTLVPEYPCICLICGAFVCTQSNCCAMRGIGECNLHSRECSSAIGIYFNIKACALVLLSHTIGCTLDAPYLDIHGEADRGLSRGKPQFLNVKRYNELRRVWMSHSIASLVSRQMEQAPNTISWLSL